MEPQNYEIKRAEIVKAFKEKLSQNRALLKQRIKLSWSNWGFGLESLDKTAQRLNRNHIEWIELHGNRYGKDLGYRSQEVLKILGRYNIKVAGLCGMFSRDNDLAGNSGIVRQQAVDYLRRQLDLCHETGGTYILVAPSAVGRPQPYDDSEFDRSVETLRLVADDFIKAGVHAAIEPIRSAEVSLVHTIADARRYIQAVNHPGIQHINGDVYHMQTEEASVAGAIMDAGSQLVNLHLADSNRCALGDGHLDLDAILMALYLLDYPEGRRFATPEPLGPGGDPYPAMFGKPQAAVLDTLVEHTANYWRKREEQIKTLV